jgi:hypothetical protein
MQPADAKNFAVIVLTSEILTSCRREAIGAPEE